MKVFVVLAILAVASVSGAPGEQKKGTKVEPETKRGGKYYSVSDPAQTCKTSAPGTSFCTQHASCNQGNKIYTCTESFQNTEPIACSGTTPYCSGEIGFAKCTAFPERFCETDSNYICPGVGYFPDLYNCYAYYDCYYSPSLKRIIPQKLQCPYGYPFNVEGEGDQKCVGGAKCVTPKCSTTIAAEWVPLNYTTYDTTMAVYCLNGRPKYVYSCPVGLSLNINSIYNSESPNCIVKCTRDYQKAPNVNDNSRYYECRGGVAYNVLCTRERIFDPYTETCIYKTF